MYMAQNMRPALAVASPEGSSGKKAKKARKGGADADADSNEMVVLNTGAVVADIAYLGHDVVASATVQK